MEELINRWENEYQYLVDKAEQYRYTSEHNFKKITYKALQLKYCIKDLREQCAINGVVFNEAKTIDKQVQAKLIEEIMKSDEELGLYSEVEAYVQTDWECQKQCDCGGNERVGLDCTMKPCKHTKYNEVLNTAIEKAKPNLDKINDVDQWLDSIR